MHWLINWLTDLQESSPLLLDAWFLQFDEEVEQPFLDVGACLCEVDGAEVGSELDGDLVRQRGGLQVEEELGLALHLMVPNLQHGHNTQQLVVSGIQITYLGWFWPRVPPKIVYKIILN